MNIYFDDSGLLPTFYLEGEIDHHTAPQIKDAIDTKLLELRPGKAVLDFKRVTFSDSSAIAVVIGRHQLMKSIGGRIIVKNVNDNVKRVFILSGVDKIVSFAEDNK